MISVKLYAANVVHGLASHWSHPSASVSSQSSPSRVIVPVYYNITCRELVVCVIWYFYSILQSVLATVARVKWT